MLYKLAKEYFIDSEERFYAWLLLLGVILGVVALVVINVMFASWSVGFWTALSSMSYPLYMESLKSLLVLTISYVGANIFKEYLLGLLKIEWREWLTETLTSKFVSQEPNNYLELERHPSQIDNPSQRIQEDVPNFVDQSLKLGIDFLQSAITLVTFIASLWVIGGAATFAVFGATIIIPGYLVWVAILFAGLSGLVTHLIGGDLVGLSDQRQGLEADFRGDIALLSNNAESVAQDRGEDYFKQSLMGKLGQICRNAYDILNINIGITAFNSFIEQIGSIFPYLVAAPLYFAKQTSLGQLMEIGFSFGQIQSSLSWFSNSYQHLARYGAIVNRLNVLQNTMEDDGLVTTSRAIVVQENDTNALSIRNLNILEPSTTASIMRELNLTFRQGENTIIKARSGLGKSTLYKAIAGTWKYGNGDVFTPNGEGMYFVPQRPVLRNDTLKAVLAYPDPENMYTHEQYIEIMQAIGDMDQFIAKLDTKASWSKTFSQGQQQRIAFARALLKQPKWLFLDEATSSLDEDTEHRMYSLVRDRLKTTTFISIGHRSTIDQHHNRVLIFDADDQKRVTARDAHGFFLPSSTAANDEGIMRVPSA